MLNLVSVFIHPANTDPTARLITGNVRRDAIYSTSGGFVAIYSGQAVEGYFPSLSAAEGVLASLTIGNGIAIPEHACERCGMTIRRDEPIPCWHRDCPEPSGN